jgi:hypothetical protein
VRRLCLYFALTLAACSGGSSPHPDAPVDTPAGSAMAAWGETQPSPRDHSLEISVLVASAFVVAGPATMKRRKSS